MSKMQDTLTTNRDARGKTSHMVHIREDFWLAGDGLAKFKTRTCHCPFAPFRAWVWHWKALLFFPRQSRYIRFCSGSRKNWDQWTTAQQTLPGQGQGTEQQVFPVGSEIQLLDRQNSTNKMADSRLLKNQRWNFHTTRSSTNGKDMAL